MNNQEYELRQSIIKHCLEMNANGLNQGTSGNISARIGDRMLITPSATPYEKLQPEMIVSMALDDASGAWEGTLRPSSEWRMHRDIMAADGSVSAVVHAHPIHATAVSILRRDIPACHYMIAAFGGSTVRCAQYATFGTEELSRNALAALDGRQGCLLANHGIITIGNSLEKAMWRAVELETLARQYQFASLMGEPVILSDEQIDDAKRRFANYGIKES